MRSVSWDQISISRCSKVALSSTVLGPLQSRKIIPSTRYLVSGALPTDLRFAPLLPGTEVYSAKSVQGSTWLWSSSYCYLPELPARDRSCSKLPHYNTSPIPPIPAASSVQSQTHDTTWPPRLSLPRQFSRRILHSSAQNVPGPSSRVRIGCTLISC